MRISKGLALNLLLAVAAPTIFFAIVEASLWIAGVRPLSLTEDPYVGFAASQPLFLLQSDGETMATNPVKLTHFNSQTFLRKKPPGTYRIFTLGGSTTYGHPWRDPVSYSGWLRQLLPIADPSRKYEVINCGGISYASYREAMLAAELIQYQPDLFIVYSGHNEFLEERTYRKTAGIPSIVRELSALLDHTRTYSILRRMALKTGNPGNGQVTPGISSPGTGTGNSEGGGNHSDGKRPELAGEVDDVLAKTIGPTSYVRNDTLKQEVLEHFRASLERIAKLAHSAGAQVLFVTTPSNERNCTPFKSEPSPGIAPENLQRVAKWGMTAETVPPALALLMLDSALTLDPRDAALCFQAGMAAYAVGQFPKAKTYFAKAIEEDICPLRALPVMRGIVREVADQTDSRLLDFTGFLEARTLRATGNDILGEPDFVDHVHLSIDDYRLLAQTIIDTLAASGELRLSPTFDTAAVKRVVDRVMSGMGPHELGEGLHNIAKVVNWAGKHDDAARVAERALAVDSTGLEAIWSSLFVGAARERQGREDEAIVHYRRAVRLDSNNPLSRQYLGAALERKGEFAAAAREFRQILDWDPGDPDAQAHLNGLKSKLEASAVTAESAGMTVSLPDLNAAVQKEPNRADLRTLLGTSQLRIGKASEATQNFKRALELNPNETRAMLGLAKIAQASGNLPEAINLYAKALSIDPHLEEARAALSGALGNMSGHP